MRSDRLNDYKEEKGDVKSQSPNHHSEVEFAVEN